LAGLRETSASSKSLTIIAFVLAIAALYLGRTVFIPLALALVLSFLLTPFVNQLERVRLRRVPSVLIVVVLALGLIGLATWAAAGQLVEIMVQLPDYKANLDLKINSLHGASAGKLGKATASIQELNKELAAVPNQIAGHAQATNQGTSRPIHPLPVQVAPPASSFVQDLGELLGPLTAPIETAIIVIIFTMFMLVKREDLRNRAIRLAGRGQLSRMTQAFDDASRRLSRFLLLQCLVNAGYGLLFGLGLYFLGLPHALLWGMILGFFRFIPYIGTIAAAALPIAMAVAVFPGWRQAGIAFALFVVLELIVSNFIEPMLYGSHTGISSLAILVAAVFWTTLWGPVGLILSTPLTVCLVVLGRYVPQLQFLEIALGDEPALSPEQLFYQRLIAMDADEARSIAEAYLIKNGAQQLYESVFIPALRMTEQDYYIDVLHDNTRRFIVRSVREFVEDIGEKIESPSVRALGAISELQLERRSAKEPNVHVSCIPVRAGSDDLASMMLAQLLRHAGYQTLELNAGETSAGGTEERLGEISRQHSGILCVSCLPPLATGAVRSLCKRLKSEFPDRKIIAGFWGLEGGVPAAQERMGIGPADSVVTTLSDALASVHRFGTLGGNEGTSESQPSGDHEDAQIETKLST
jgi:predicted PurR-regulated permease PerM